MNEELIQRLLTNLFDVKYRSENYNFDAIRSESRTVIEQIIRQHILDYRDEKLGILQAKVFVYEEMIAKSTFAPMLIPKEEKVEEIIEPEPYQREMLFTQRQVENLAQKVYEIVGEGEVMKLFNELLCINSGS